MKTGINNRLRQLEQQQRERSRPTMEEIREAIEAYSETGVFPPGTPEDIRTEVRQVLEAARLIDQSVLGEGYEHQETVV